MPPAAQPADTPPATAARADGEGSAWPRPRTLTSSELRELADQWRAKRDPEDAERSEKIARVLEWLASQREPKLQPKTRLQAVSARISAWVGLH